VEYDAGGRFIDILAVDKNGQFVVIELKVSKGYDRVIGQLLRYIAWVEKNLSDGVQVRGFIVANEISDDLRLATRKIPGVKLFQYKLAFSLEDVPAA
jgi:RecB family endonuclease NucS